LFDPLAVSPSTRAALLTWTNIRLAEARLRATGEAPGNLSEILAPRLSVLNRIQGAIRSDDQNVQTLTKDERAAVEELRRELKSGLDTVTLLQEHGVVDYFTQAASACELLLAESQFDWLNGTPDRARNSLQSAATLTTTHREKLQEAIQVGLPLTRLEQLATVASKETAIGLALIRLNQHVATAASTQTNRDGERVPATKPPTALPPNEGSRSP